MSNKTTWDSAVAATATKITGYNICDDLTSGSSYISGTISIGEQYVTKDQLQKIVQDATKPKEPDVSPEVKSTMHHDGRRISITTYDNGFKKATKDLLPDIKDIITHNDRVVIVKFADGTQEKAVLYPDDKFTVEQGISICLAKKLMGGSSIYNKVIEYALDIVDKKDKAQKKKIADAAVAKENAAKAAKKRAERKAQKREEYIKTQAEIMARAMIIAKENKA
jgi:hypothetical protein